ncbi:hypothetical protein [Cupriavidus oxalaticus]|uniref:Cytochrome c domain-containing protein n=1 Tax=Cupriavidus oxalaticus TaxID=96344 RepID=A0A375FN99_9BURK|nr:hypothetical protein [Cupriavidus oxalaticus]QRQ85856.1 hypothetical protein JTE91_21570 [Cupriavidus oxalaticus]QRQ95818.1 hypothetical protein JTE92_20690 [Cupriavidus oxalaticus]WQD84495.1 hypothetical protein U0036_08430 [Cupriavidus oxalaticus]SPC06591.1 conserved exported hypothetical protein [Cupriavidus oxalaticus]SPC12429.1 conserved exported hypothetical protein [Cupriavidus oxalaticus]
MKAFGIPCLALAAGVLSATLSGPCRGEGVSFARDIKPMLVQNCAACHQGMNAPASLDLLPKVIYTSLVGVKSTQSPMLRVAPSAPDASYLVRKLEGAHLEVGGQGVAMPPGAPPLDPAQVGAIRQWIGNGAMND